MAVSFHKRPGRGRSSAGQVRRYQPAGQDAAQVRPHGHRSGQPHRRVAAPTPGGGRGTAGCGLPALRKHHWWCPATSGNPSVTAAPCQLPLHKGALGTGDADRRVASLLAMTVLILCHSEEAQRADVGIRPFYDGRGFGPPYLGHGLRRPNFVPKFGASVRSSAPTEGQRCNSGLPASEQGCSPCIPGPGRRPPHCGSRDRSSLFARGFDPLPDS